MLKKEDERKRGLPGRQEIVEGIRGLRARADGAEVAARNAKEENLRLRGQLDDAIRDLKAAKADVKRLENIVVQLNIEEKTRLSSLEEAAKRIQSVEFEKQGFAARAQVAVQRAQETEKRTGEVLHSIQAARDRLRQEQSKYQALEARNKEMETLAKVAKKLQTDAEKRAQTVEAEKQKALTRADVAVRKRKEAELGLSAATETIQTLRFQLASTSKQRDEHASKSQDLETQLTKLQTELDSISSLFLSSSS